MANYEFKSAHIENYNKYKHILLTVLLGCLHLFMNAGSIHICIYETTYTIKRTTSMYLYVLLTILHMNFHTL